MENRRPPRSNSSGKKPAFGLPSGASPFRGSDQGGNTSANAGRPPSRSRDVRRQAQGPAGRQGDSRWEGDSTNKRFSGPRGPGSGPHGPGGGARGPRGRDDRSGRGGPPRRPDEELIEITSDCQITDGRFRGQSIHNSDSPNTTHADRRLREVVFRTISTRVKSGRVLDLGAGCGTIGIEALSRGAMLTTFVERSSRMCTLLRKNLEVMGIKDGHGEVAEIEILPFLKRAAQRKRVWDIIYFDLPQEAERAAILDRISLGCAIRSRGIVIIAHPAAHQHEEKLNHLKRWRTIDHGETILTIYERI